MINKIKDLWFRLFVAKKIHLVIFVINKSNNHVRIFYVPVYFNEIPRKQDEFVNIRGYNFYVTGTTHHVDSDLSTYTEVSVNWNGDGNWDEAIDAIKTNFAGTKYVMK